MIPIPISQLTWLTTPAKSGAVKRQPVSAQSEEVAHGQWSTPTLTGAPIHHTTNCAKQGTPVRQIEEPSMKDMAKNLVSALKAWALAGFPVLSDQDARERGEMCAGTDTIPKCSAWQPEARGGMGKCMLCGCTNLKWWLATAKCPKAKWKK